VGPSCSSAPPLKTRRAAGSRRRPGLQGCVERLGGAAAQQRPHARHQFGRREGLGEVVVGADVQALDLVGFLRARRQHDDRQGLGARVLTPARQQADAGVAGQHPVQHDQVGQLGQQRGLRVGPRDGNARFVPLMAQVQRDQFGDRGLVLDNQHASHQFTADSRPSGGV
jgi:hypothetical protein